MSQHPSTCSALQISPLTVATKQCAYVCSQSSLIIGGYIRPKSTSTYTFDPPDDSKIRVFLSTYHTSCIRDMKEDGLSYNISKGMS
jgi:hypothetical protein